MILVVIMVLLVPLLLLTGAFTSALGNRTSELRSSLDEETALLAAESGVDEAIYHGQVGTLTSGTAWSTNLGSGMRFTVKPTYLGHDLVDNDKDGATDEADENVYEIDVTGTYRNTTRKLAAYLGPVPLLPTINYAVGTFNPAVTISLSGTPQISGNPVTMAGVATGGAAVSGLSIAPPGTLAHLSSELTGSEPSKVVGAGGTPSIGTTAAVNLVSLVTQVQNIANLVLTSNKYSAYSFGNGPAGTTKIAYRNGNVTFAGNSRGAGILAVTGDLTITGTFRFDGVVIVLGKFDNSAGTAEIYGSLLSNGTLVQGKGTMSINYCPAAIALANSISGRYVSFNGWQELAK